MEYVAYCTAKTALVKCIETSTGGHSHTLRVSSVKKYREYVHIVKSNLGLQTERRCYGLVISCMSGPFRSFCRYQAHSLRIHLLISSKISHWCWFFSYSAKTKNVKYDLASWKMLITNFLHYRMVIVFNHRNCCRKRITCLCLYIWQEKTLLERSASLQVPMVWNGIPGTRV